MITLETILESTDNFYRTNIQIGSTVLVAEKKNYRNGKLTEGKVAKILTNKSRHPRGVKVRLENGIVGRVQKIINK